MNGVFDPQPPQGDAEPVALSAIDSAAEARAAARERLQRALGKVAVDIERVANAEAIDAIKRQNPGVDFGDEDPTSTETAESIRERLGQGLEEAIRAKRDDVLEDYRERLARDSLLDN